jgi:hypothetical protein
MFLLGNNVVRVGFMIHNFNLLVATLVKKIKLKFNK